MIKNLFFIILLGLNGCIVYVPSANSNWGAVALEDPYVDCIYDGYYDLSRWHFEIYADSYYGPLEVSTVGFYINNEDFQLMEYVGNGLWVKTITTTWYDCDRYYHFDFVATDYDGYEGYYAHHW